MMYVFVYIYLLSMELFAALGAVPKEQSENVSESILTTG